MLEDIPESVVSTTPESSTEAPAPDAPASKPAPRRRRAASRPAGPPPEGSTDAEAAPAAEAASGDAVAGAAEEAPAPTRRRRTKSSPTFSAEDTGAAEAGDQPSADAKDAVRDAAAAAALLFQAPDPTPVPAKRSRRAPASTVTADDDVASEPGAEPDDEAEDAGEVGDETDAQRRRRRRRGGRGRRKRTDETTDDEPSSAAAETDDADETEAADTDEDSDGTGTRRRRRRRRRGTGGSDGDGDTDDPPNTVVRVREPRRRGGAARDDDDAVRSVSGSTRLEAKKQRRREGREQGRRRASIVTEAEFLARRESVDRAMVVRQTSDRTQIAVIEDGMLVEHYVDRSAATSFVGNVYLGRVQNVLPSMEAAFVDIGKGRNAVLYAGEVNWDAASLDGQPRRIEHAMKSGDSVLVQVTKDPVGHKGARLTAQISLPGRFLVYVPDGSMTGISRKLPDTERNRLKKILKAIVPEDAGVIVRTAAEGASEEELTHDVARLQAQWEDIDAKSSSASAPALLYGEPDMTVRVVRDIFNEDFARLVISGDEAWDTIDSYLRYVAPDLAERAERWTPEGDVFAAHRVDEQLAKALDRKVWLPSGGSLVIDRTEAMTVIDVNTGKFTGAGGNLEETVTKNNLEAAEEIVRQLRLRDVGGIIVIDFIDMVLEANRDLVLRRLTECLGRDRTRHQVAEVTSLGLVQMTRKRVGQGLLEAFSDPCEVCHGRGVLVHTEPVPLRPASAAPETRRRGRKEAAAAPARTPSPRDLAAHPRTHTEDEGGGDAAVDSAPEVAPGDAETEAPKATKPRRRKASRAAAPPDAPSATDGGEQPNDEPAASTA